MLNIDRSKFYSSIRGKLGKLTQAQVDGLNAILDCMEKDPALTEIQHAAYMLATIWHETARTCEPIEEFGRGKGHSYGRPDLQTGKAYYGRGYVQLTWKRNYEQMGKLLGIDLVDNPEKAFDPDVAYMIMTLGMHLGIFTGKKLIDYGPFNGSYDFLHARKIINGMDKAPMIAEYARAFEEALK